MNVDAVVLDLEVMLRAMIGARVRLVMDLDGELPEVSADPNQLRRLLVNLAVNARDAMPSGGVLTIETRHAAGRRSRRDPHPRHRHGHGRGGARAPVRAVFHDQAGG